ncbi:hypothetical protein DTO96_102151 [Ephemeroptericola cinctiostellae]|uniref:Uncharacterized protein n=1 Tax=Ephemeroptericola cinctiostellae TaxID=2268024 RepID=A0A345DDF9_9BURK|nr:hypothetical protein [Ephemeroptericola cinctiostellae]AXF86397.1 hypothetical protein DTO96_102151 [Ephemeroptericola cinctiostellae]
MTPTTQPSDIGTAILADGYKTDIDGKQVPYTIVKLRPATVGMDLDAIRLAERVVYINGKPALMLSDAVYRIAITMLRIDRLECTDSNVKAIGHSLMDMDMMARLTPHDLNIVEERIALYDLAEQVRYGNISQADFDAIFNPSTADAAKQTTPQPTGETGAMDEPSDQPRPFAGRLDA